MSPQLESTPWVVAQYRILAALGEILRDPCQEQRRSPRLSFFGPVSLRLPGSADTQMSAFARDISPAGIGLVHLMPVAEIELIVALSLPSGRGVLLRTEILWCRDYGNGWYASGGRFVDVATAG